MADDPRSGGDAADILSELMRTQTDAAKAFFGQLFPGMKVTPSEAADAAQWTEIAQRMQKMWLDFQAEQAKNPANPPAFFSDRATGAAGSSPASPPEFIF